MEVSFMELGKVSFPAAGRPIDRGVSGCRAVPVLAAAILVSLLSVFPGPEAFGSGLTIERMYSDPRPAGVAPREIAWSPDGGTLAFLWNDGGARFYDIWLCDASGGNLRRATDASAIEGTGEEVLTKAEVDRLATQRRKGKGIQSFRWASDGKRIVFPLEGDLFILDAGSGRVKRLFGTAAAETDPAFSPDGKRMAFVRENDIWMIELETGIVTQLTTCGSDVLYNGLGDYVDYEEVGREDAFWWSPDGARIAYVQTDVGPIRELMIPDYLGTFVDARKQLRPVAGGDNSSKRLGVLSLDTRETVWVEPGVGRDEYICRVLWHPGGRELLFLSEPRDLESLHFLAVDAAGGTIDTLLTVRDGKWVNISSTFVRWGDGGRYVYFTSEESGWNHIHCKRWKGGPIEVLTSGPWEVTSLHTVDSEGRVWYTSTELEPGQRHLYYVDGNGGRFRVTRGEGWYGSHVSKGAEGAAVAYSNPSTPPDIYILKSMKGSKVPEARGHGSGPGKGSGGGAGAPSVYSRRTGRGREMPPGLRRVTRSPAGDFAAIELPDVHYFTFASPTDGGTVHAALLLPPQLGGVDVAAALEGRLTGGFTGKYPAIVSVHGGGYAQSVRKSWRWGALYEAYLVNEMGYVLLDLDYRGSSGYGRKFRTDVHLALGGPDLEDEMAGLGILGSFPFVDPERIGIWGWSYGGYMTVLAMLRHPDSFAAGAAVAPVTDWRNYDTHYTEERLGLPREEPGAYSKGSPITYADSLRRHLLVIHGMVDDNVHFQDTVQLVEAMTRTGVDFEVMFYPAGKHGIRADASRIHLFRKITRHFERYLKGDPDAHCP